MGVKKQYELWEKNNKGGRKIGSFNSLEKLKQAWSRNDDVAWLEARAFVGDGYVLINKDMPKRRVDPFDINDHNDRIIERAVYFTVVRFLGVGKFERHESPTKKEAVELAQKLSRKAQRKYMIYAVNPEGNSAFVSFIRP